VIDRTNEVYKRDIERVRRIREMEERACPTHKKRLPGGSCLLFLLAFVVAAVAAYYVLKHLDRLPRIFPEKAQPKPLQVEPDDGTY